MHREAWDKKYVEVEDEVLFHLILAANFLDIKDLLDLTCKTVCRSHVLCFSGEIADLEAVKHRVRLE
jgi:hypothetical protein